MENGLGGNENGGKNMVCVLRDREKDHNWEGSSTALLLSLWISQWQGIDKLIEHTFLKCKVSITCEFFSSLPSTETMDSE